MAAVRKPTAMHEASGAFKAHPARALERENEPDTGRGVGPAPDYLDEAQRKAWDDIVEDCAPGVFQSSDRSALEVLAMLRAEFRGKPSGMSARRILLMSTLWARFGMTPSDRSRVRVVSSETGKPKSGIASFRR